MKNASRRLFPMSVNQTAPTITSAAYLRRRIEYFDDGPRRSARAFAQPVVALWAGHRCLDKVSERGELRTMTTDRGPLDIGLVRQLELGGVERKTRPSNHRLGCPDLIP